MTDDTLVLRRAQTRDAGALEALLLDTFECTWRPNLSAAAATAFLQEGRAAAYVAQSGDDFWVAAQGQEVVGFVHWQDDFVHALHVGSAHTRSGVGSRLMDWAEPAMAAAGHVTARLETDTFNVRSRAFYEGRGYQEIGRYPDEEWSSGLTTVLMVKRLL